MPKIEDMFCADEGALRRLPSELNIRPWSYGGYDQTRPVLKKGFMSKQTL